MGQPLIVLAPGGLGNQLFAVAAALHISEQLGRKVFVFSNDAELVKKSQQITSQTNASSKVVIVRSEKINLMLNKTSSRILIATSKLRKVKLYFKSKLRTVENPWEFPSDLLEFGTTPWILRGFFQDVNLIQNLSEESKNFILNLLTLDDHQVKFSKTPSSSTIGIHVRRGDYKFIPSYGTLSVNYFKKILYLVERQESRVLLASDDSDFLEEFQYGGVVERLFPQEFSPLETMSILAKADIFLMSNSTFSFWIGWAVSMRGGSVYIPSPWFKEEPLPARFLEIDGFVRVLAEFE